MELNIDTHEDHMVLRNTVLMIRVGSKG